MMNSRLFSHSDSSFERERAFRFSYDLAGSLPLDCCLFSLGDTESKTLMPVVRVSLLLEELGPAVPMKFLVLLLPLWLYDYFSDDRLFFELGTILSFDEFFLSVEF